MDCLSDADRGGPFAFYSKRRVHEVIARVAFPTDDKLDEDIEVF